MIFDINKQELSRLYNKTREMYSNCIQNKDNSFLQEEILIPLEQIELKNSSIKVCFSQDIDNRYSWETSITLWDGSSIIGKYIYIEDDQRNFLDEFLGFF